MNRIIRFSVLGICLLWLSGCASTEITTNWRDQSYTGTIHKVLVLAVAKKDTTRKAFETAFVNDLQNWGVKAIPGFSVLPSADSSKEVIEAKARELKVDSILVTKLVDVKKEKQRVTDITRDGGLHDYPYPYYDQRFPYRYYPYYDHWYHDYSSSFTTVRSYDVEYKTLELETNLYAISSGHLIWTAISRTTTADPLQTKVADIVQVLMRNLAKQGLL